MPKIEIKRGSDVRFPFEVSEMGALLNAFATYQEAVYYRSGLFETWKSMKARKVAK